MKSIYLIDLRKKEEYKKFHVKGAIREHIERVKKEHNSKLATEPKS